MPIMTGKEEHKAECCKNYSGYSGGMEVNTYINIICLIIYNHLISIIGSRCRINLGTLY